MPLSGCYSDDTTGSDNEDKTTPVEMVGVKLSDVTYVSSENERHCLNDTIKFAVSCSPSNATQYKGKDLDENDYELVMQKDNDDPIKVGISSPKKQFFNVEYKFVEEGIYKFYTKYCNHDEKHLNDGEDIISNKITIQIKAPEAIDYYGYSLDAGGRASIYGKKRLKLLKKVDVPTEIDGHPVYAISRYGFDGFVNLENIKIPSPISSIGNYAFNGCENLKWVWFNNKITTFGEYAFKQTNAYAFFESPSIQSLSYNQKVDLAKYITDVKDVKENDEYTYAILNNDDISLYLSKVNGKTVTIPSKIDDLPVVNIGSNCFYNKTMIETILFDSDSNLKEINNYAFAYCSNIKEIKLPKGIEYIGNYAFNGCASLKYVCIPNSLVTLGEYVFQNCSSSLTVIFESNSFSTSYNQGLGINKYIYGYKDIFVDGDFTYCVSNEGNLGLLSYNGSATKVVIPEEANGKKVTSILKYAFTNKTFVKEFVFPNSLVSIGSYAFSGCTAITYLEFKIGIESVGAHAFSGCSSLKYVVLPNTLTSFGEYMFENCHSKLKVLYEGSSFPTGYSINIGISRIYLGYKGIKFDNNTSLVYALKNNNEYAVFDVIKAQRTYSILDTLDSMKVTTIAGYAFNNINDEFSIELNDNMLEIKSHAINLCPNCSISCNKKLTTVGEYGFYNVKLINFASDTLGLSLGDNSLDSYRGAAVYLPKNITHLGTALFNNTNFEVLYYDGTFSDFNAINKNTTLTKGWGTGSKIKHVFCSDTVLDL